MLDIKAQHLGETAPKMVADALFGEKFDVMMFFHMFKASTFYKLSSG